MLIRDLAKRYTGIAYSNLVLNGNFTNTTGWSAAYCSISAASNTLTVTGTGGFSRPYVRYTFTNSGNPKIYVVIKLKSTNADASNIKVDLIGSTSGSINALIQNSPIQNNQYTLSAIKDVSGLVGNIITEISSQYANAATANAKAIEVKEYMCVDLTAIGHADKDLAWCNANLPFKP